MCPSLGRYFAGDSAEGAKCFRFPKRRKKEGCAGWRHFYNFPEKWTTAETKEVQRKFCDPTVALRAPSKTSPLLCDVCRYRELCRYLRVVQSAEYALWELHQPQTLLQGSFSPPSLISSPDWFENSLLLPSRLQHLRDLIPFFLCLEGDFTSAVDSLLRPGNGPVSRFTPQLFLNYLCIFRSATAPKVTIGHPSHLWHCDEVWEPIQGLSGYTFLKQMVFSTRFCGKA